MPLVAFGVVTLSLVLAAAFFVRARALATRLSQAATQHAALERSLLHAQSNEATLRHALEAASQFLWDGDLVTGKVSGSPEAGQWLGYPSHEWPPDPWNRIVHEDDRAAVDDAIRQAVRGKTPTYRVRHRLRRKDGSVLHALSTGVVIRDGAGRPTRFVGFVRDLTREVEEEDHRAQVQKLESLGLLAGGIAHDFNNLLSVVTSSLDVAASTAKGSTDTPELLATARAATTRATALTRQLLAYAGRAPVAQTPVDVNALVESMPELLRVTLPKSVTFARELAAVPPVLGDPGQLQQVVMNLITNGAEAIGDAAGTVTLRTEAFEAGVRITVADTGRGMTPEVQARIFDPFFSTKGPGRGLGLAALSGIVKAHHGTIRVDSTPGRGTTFTVELPTIAGAAALPLPSAAPAAAVAARAPVKLAVLLVDDEALVRTATKRALERLGCKVDLASSGDEAISRVRETPGAWQLVVMDVTMPGTPGTAAAEILRGIVPGLPIILCSGYSEAPPAMAERVFFLPKPHTLEDLDAMLRQAMGAQA